MDIKPFQVSIPQSDLDDLQSRLARTRWPNYLPDVGWTYGVPDHYVRRLVDYWRTGYDWRKWEAKLNAYPQFVTELEGQKIHFIHVRSPEPDALPVILTHGWPGSIFEFIKVIEPLTNPRAHGGQADQAFHLVIPSLPGFGFSGPTSEPGWHPERIAKVWAQLMHGLGYERYGAVGNDWGSIISPLIGRFNPAQVVGTHVTQIFLEPSSPDDLPDPTAEELEALAGLDWFKKNMNAYDLLQSQQPQTLAYALSDSPMGLLAWFCLIYREGEGIDDDFVLTNASLYWLTETIASSTRIYFEARHMEKPSSDPIETPIGLAMFRDDGRAFRRLADRLYTRITQWTLYDTGGHYAAYQVPELWLADVRKFFHQLR
ncbi:MAG: alpha/beta fold hydrolase [Anaerolineaceae bacterium]|nr:alpha/beta fold hydrolase [Anaerolineaceae bacterium]